MPLIQVVTTRKPAGSFLKPLLTLMLLLAAVEFFAISLPLPLLAATDAPSGYGLHFTRTSSQYAGSDVSINLVEYTAVTLEAWIKADSFAGTSPYISSIAGEGEAGER